MGFQFRGRKKLIFLVKILFLLIFIGLIFYQIRQEIKKIISDHYFSQVKAAFLDQDYPAMFEIYGYINQEGINNNYYRQHFAFMLCSLGSANEIEKSLAIIKLKKILKNLNVSGFGGQLAQARAYKKLGEQNNKFLKLAENSFRQIVAISPQMPVLSRELGEVYLQQGEYLEAEQELKKALKNLPNINNFYINKSHKRRIKYEKYLIYKDLGDLFLDRKNYLEAEKYYKLAYNNYLDDYTLLKKIADTYYLRGDIDTAIKYNLHGMMRDPRDYVWAFSVALLYQEKNNLSEAKKYAQKALILSKNNFEVQQFINNLNKKNE